MTDTPLKQFVVPDLGEGLTEASVTSWSVAVGDQVELNQTLCTLETNKAEVEIPSPYAGRIVELGGSQGDVLAVGSLLVRIDTSAPVLVGYGADAGLDASRRPSRPRAAPAVRRLATDLNVDLAGLRASGAGGVITRDDVLAAADEPTDVTSVVGVRARMAERMTLSRNKIPDAHASVQVDCTELVRLNQTLSSAELEVSPFVLTLRLLTIALRRHPVLNSTWVDGAESGPPQVQLHGGVNLGIAVATERGLVVPVLAGAQDLTTRQLAGRAAELIIRAREGGLSGSDSHGSTFTVSNYGALGLDDGVPVINYPEAAILGMGSLKPRPVVVDGAVVARPTMALTCAFDHRVADGAQVAAFLTTLRGLIEAPQSALLDL